MAKSFTRTAALVPVPGIRRRQRPMPFRPVRVSGVQWRWVLLAGLGAPALTALAAVLFNAGCSLFGLDLVQPGGYWLSVDCPSAFLWGVSVLNLLCTFCLAFWVARKAGTRVVLHGVLIGLVSVLSGLTVGFVFKGVFAATAGFYYPNVTRLFVRLPFRLALRSLFRLRSATLELCRMGLVPLTVAAGWWGGRICRTGQAEREALYRAIWAISTAIDPQEIVAAIGEHLAGPEVSHVILWRMVPAEGDAPGEIVPLAMWSPCGGGTRPPVLRLAPEVVQALSQPRQNGPLLLKVDAPPFSGQSLWERLGARSAQLLPLATSGDVLVGVLMLASPAAAGLKRGIWYTHPISAQVALALENLRLVEQVRQAAVLEERQRLAREIHDTLAQGFTSIVMHLEAAEQSLPGRLEQVHRHLDQARCAARVSLGQARQVVWALRPDILEKGSLAAALERATKRWAEGGTVKASVATTGTALPLPPDVEVTLLRAAQEALANVRKHAQADHVAVTLSYMGDMVVLDVQDDGQGFDPARTSAPSTVQATGGFGLTAMRERIEQLGGKLLVESSCGEGTTLVVEIPFPGNRQPKTMSL